MNPTRPIQKLQTWLAESVALNRAMRWFRPAFRDAVAQDIAEDVVKVQATARDAAYSAEQYDLAAEQDVDEAAKHLEAALTGGLDSSDIGTVQAAIKRLKQARTNVRRSAEKDHVATEILATA